MTRRSKSLTFALLKCKKDNIDGTFLKCAGCRRALYCSRECQKVDWKEGGHRGDCQTCAVMSELGTSNLITFKLPG